MMLKMILIMTTFLSLFGCQTFRENQAQERAQLMGRNQYYKDTKMYDPEMEKWAKSPKKEPVYAPAILVVIVPE